MAAVLLQYMQAQDRGEEVDQDAIVAQHPDLAEDLGSYFETLRMVENARVRTRHAVPGPPVLEAKRRFADYELLRELGRGGMGVVYLARQVSIPRLVAVKMPLAGAAASETDIARFQLEAKAAANLRHPNIVAIHEVGICEGQHYFSMDFVDGPSLKEVVKEKPLPPKEAVRYAKQIAETIEFAHQKGTLHRDLKPSNILIDRLGQPLITDFGLARPSEGGAGCSVTGEPLGTLSYMPPEQIAAKRASLGPACDVYSLGATLYELVTGRPPFQGDSFSDTMWLVLNSEAVQPRLLNTKLPVDLQTICMKCLEKDPRRRYSSAGELADDLGRFLEDRPIKARPVGLLTRFWRWCRRNRTLATLMGLAALSLLVLAVLGVVLGQINAQAADDRAKAAEVNAAEIELQNILRSVRTSGWSERAWDVQSKTVSLCDKKTLPEVRDQTAAILSGLDARQSKRIESFGAGDILFDRQGTRVLLGTVRDAKRHLIGAKFWNIETDRFQDLPSAGEGPLAFSSDGIPLQLIVRKQDKLQELILLDLLHNTAAQRFTLPNGAGSSDPPVLALLPDASLVAASVTSGDQNLALAVWDRASGRLLRQFPDKAVVAAVSADGSLVAAGNEDGQVLIGAMKTGQWIGTFRRGYVEMTCLAFTRDPHRSQNAGAEGAGWLLAAGDEAGGLTIWDVGARMPRSFCRGSQYQVLAVAFSPDRATLASGGRGEVRLWDVATGRMLLRIPTGDYIASLAFSPDGRRLCCGTQPPAGDRPQVFVWDVELGRGISTHRGLASQVAKVCFSADGKRLAALAHDWQVGIWDLPSGRLLHVVDGPKGFAADNAGLAFSPDGRRFAMSAGREARLWDVETGETAKSWKLPLGISDSLAFAAADKLLLLRAETRDPTAGPFSNYLPRQYPRVCRLRNLLGDSPSKAIAEVDDFNWHVFGIGGSSAGKCFAIEGLGGASGKGASSCCLTRLERD